MPKQLLHEPNQLKLEGQQTGECTKTWRVTCHCWWHCPFCLTWRHHPASTSWLVQNEILEKYGFHIYMCDRSLHKGMLKSIIKSRGWQSCCRRNQCSLTHYLEATITITGNHAFFMEDVLLPCWGILPGKPYVSACTLAITWVTCCHSWIRYTSTTVSVPTTLEWNQALCLFNNTRLVLPLST